jgi:hypothetical protein
MLLNLKMCSLLVAKLSFVWQAENPLKHNSVLMVYNMEVEASILSLFSAYLTFARLEMS